MLNPPKGNIIKQPATITEQLDKLKERGCIIEDETHAGEVLKGVNYYRLVHYFTPFLESKGKYKEGTSFNKVLGIYDFDREFRTLLLTALEEIEITLRAIFSNFHALKYGALGYKNPGTFDRTHKHQVFLTKIDRMIEHNSDTGLVTHHKGKYRGEFPLWVIMELFSFGMLTYFYKDLLLADKKAIIEDGFPHLPITPKHMESWMDALSDLRNHCAHYNRLYCQTYTITPKPAEINMDNTLFSYILIMKQLHKRPKIWNETIINQLKYKADKHKDLINLSQYGFPENWESILVDDRV